MTARVSFADRLRRLVPLARAVGWIALFAGIGVGAAAVPVRLNPVALSSAWSFPSNSLVLAVSFGFATWLVGVRFTRHSWEALGWKGWHAPGELAGHLVRGVGMGVGMAAVAVGLSFLASDAGVRVTPEWSRYALLAAPLATGLLAAALLEELAFRGLPLRLLAEAVGPWAALVVLAMAFGIAHAQNPGASPLSIVNGSLAAVWLSFAFFSPGGMGLAWGLHFGWNAGLALLFDAPVSGLTFDLPALEYRAGVRPWVDGGAFGPEGGVVGTLVFLAGTCAVLGRRFRRPSEWLAA
jgi:membrane protease YdiL (CAAX protease family)